MHQGSILVLPEETHSWPVAEAGAVTLDSITSISTLEEVGADIGVTRERVRQIQVEALKRLRVILEKAGYTVESLF